MRDPLAPPVQSRRVVPMLLWGVVIFSLLAGIGGVATYFYYQRPDPPTGPVHDANGSLSGTGKKGFQRTSYTVKPPAKDETNGTLRPEPVQVVSAPSPAPAAPVKAKAPTPAPVKPKAKPVLDMKPNPHKAPPSTPGGPLYTLPSWTYVSSTLENVLVSEIEGMFTVKTSRPIFDATGEHILIPQGQRIGAKALTATLLLGNERIPGFAISTTIHGHDVDLGTAPIMDCAGTNGLTGEVRNHWWRIVWTSLAIEGLKAGQQMLTQEIASQGDGVTISGVGQHSTNIAQQRLGRAQDNRPTITAHSGECSLILIPKSMELPAYVVR